MPEMILKSKDDFMKFNIEDVQKDVYWDLGDTEEYKIHSVHAYPAKFPAFIAIKAMQYAKNEGINISIISDIFCGCGTVALEAKLSGVNFWGCDINPVATLIASVKSTVYRKKTLRKYYDFICAEYNQIQVDITEYQKANDRLRYWYNADNYCELLRLYKAICKIPYIKYRNAFKCIFSSILKATSKWLTKSIKPQIDPNKQPIQAKKAFDAQYVVFENAALTDSRLRSEITIVQGSFLTEKDVPTVDIIITSPPYVTSYEYADLHQLSSLWLEYTDDYKTLRRGTIGSMTPDDGNYLPKVQLNSTGESIVSQLKANIDIYNSKVQAVTRYYCDMQRAIERCYHMLNKGGLAFFIIGDTEYKGVKIYNSKHLIESLFDSGFSEVRVAKRAVTGKILTPYRDERGKFTSDKTKRQIYHEEFVVIGRK